MARETTAKDGASRDMKVGARQDTSPRAVFGQAKAAPRRDVEEGGSKGRRRRNGEQSDDAEHLRKRQWKPSTLLAPVPAVMVSCGGQEGVAPNIITLAWVGTLCSEPPMLGISVRPERYSHDIIMNSKEFVVNIPSADLARATDYCGVKSGRDGDKFAGAGLTAMASEKLAVPLIAECPINLECKVKKVLKLGSHNLFLADIVSVQVSEDLLDKKSKLRIDKAQLLAYAHGEYYVLGKRLGFFGFSIKKNGTKARR